MSHYKVLVVGEDVEEALWPFGEDLEVEEYPLFTRDQAIAEGKKIWPHKTDEECWGLMAEGCRTDRSGTIYSTSNPNGKWDWYVVGGRWSNILRLKNGTRANVARLKDIDFSSDETKIQEARQFWEKWVEGDASEGEKILAPWETPEYFKRGYLDKEDFARRSQLFSTYAVITSDGEWHECGKAGWWMMRDEDAEAVRKWEDGYLDLLKNESPNSWITIVDCHC